MADTQYVFEGGFPTPETVQRAYDDADLNRAVQAYRFFYPTVSGLAIFKGTMAVGLRANRVFGAMETEPEQVGFTLNSDTPYGPILLDLREGPMVIELPPGPLICAALDLNQRWVADLGLPGPDAGNGGKHLLVPPGWDGEVPEDYYLARSTTYRVIFAVRSLPVGGDVPAAKERLPTVKVHPLDPPAGWTEPSWLDLSGQPQDTTPRAWETNLEYWRALHQVIDSESHLDAYAAQYGELAALGIAKSTPFAPDERMAGILEQAARIGNGQLRVQSFADRRPDRVVWPDRHWEWAACGSRTATSTPPTTWMSTPARSGSSRPSPPPRPCSAARLVPARCTGWACATRVAPTWMAARPTSWRSPTGAGPAVLVDHGL